MDKTKAKFTNSLIAETSPYLLQHAHNPVLWHAWNEEALALAVQENKPLLISIGYSACHWCHVMAHETFENEAAARVMNDNFICIKVDREERPDVDQIYMNAVQIMTGSGGWPLNCFALPDGRPFYGGTYYPKERWLQVCQSVAKAYQDDPQKLSKYADQIVRGIKQDDFILNQGEIPAFTIRDVQTIVSDWQDDFDLVNGGARRSPKFPMPNNQLFLLRYAFYAQDPALMAYVRLTLDKMASGGIYDHVGGGFARYSTDALWKVPHFEKMLYDNAQLVSLYAEAFRITQDPLYARVVKETLAFIQAELTSPDGVFYASLDADSEGEEGKYYTWTETELREALGEKYATAQAIFSIDADGYWESGRYILLIKNDLAATAGKLGISTGELLHDLDEIKLLLKRKRDQRVAPALDDKVLTSWNGLMIKAYADAYAAIGDPAYLERATRAANFLLENVINQDGSLLHTWKVSGKPVKGFLDDSSFLIEALIALHQADFDEKWIWKAITLAESALSHFHDEASGLFFYTSDQDSGLITRNIDISDSVIPSSNSGMAHIFFVLGHVFEEARYLELSSQMLNKAIPGMRRYPAGFSNWGLLMLQKLMPFYEVAICGSSAKEWGNAFQKHYIPNKILAASSAPSELPLLMEERFADGKTRIYVCVKNSCQTPVDSVKAAIMAIEKTFPQISPQTP